MTVSCQRQFITNFFTDVAVKFLPMTLDTRVPLPRSSRLPPSLIVENVPEEKCSELVSLIRALAPKDNRHVLEFFWISTK